MKKIFKTHLGRLGFATLLLFSIIIIHSCRKGQAKTELEQSTFNDAKAWYQSTYPARTNKNLVIASAGINNTTPDLSQLITPEWNSANTYSRLNKDVIEIPMDAAANLRFNVKAGPANGIDRQNKYSKTSFLIFTDAGKYTAYVMTVIADSAYIKNDFGKLALNTFQHRDPSFSGKLLYHTPDGKFVSGWLYKNGSLIANVKTDNAYKTNGLKTLDGPFGTDPTQNDDGSPGSGSCSDWYYILSDSDGEIITCTYLGRTCDGVQPQGPNDGQFVYPAVTGGQAGAPPSCPAGSHLDATGTCVPDIIDSVKNPCLKAMVDSIMSKNVKGKIDSLIQSVFNGTSTPDLIFTDQELISSAKRDAETESKIVNNKLISSKIRLRESILANSSKEFIAATIMHEALHAYMDSQGIDLDQHKIMAEKYLNSIASDLKKMFPGMTDLVAYSLAWGGLEGTYLYSNPGDVNCPGYQPEINTLYRAHKDNNGHTIGHGC